MVRVKICGLTDVHDARLAARLGADALGFNFCPQSPRYIRPERAKAIVAVLPPLLTTVGVFVNERPETVMEICRKVGLDAAQLHGDEPPLAVDAVQGVRRIKAIRIASEADIALCRRYRVEAYLLDAYDPGRRGGTGRTFDWKLARAAAQFGSIILAGGLTPDNVAEAIAAAAPYGVDVASGIESEPGRKDRALMADFIYRAKTAGLRLAEGGERPDRPE
jgi:phosphoribosylanthranilate isomerase